MGIRVLGISGSPRKEGNSERLLMETLSAAESAGAKTELVALRELKIGPCIECNACYRTGRCAVQDQFQDVFAKLVETDRLIFATPVFFMTVSAQAKLLIDRCQCLWSRKYVLKQPLFQDPGRDRRAMVIAVGGSRSKKMFESVRLTMQYFFDVLEINYALNLFVNRVDDRGDILKCPAAIEEARRMGRDIAVAPGPPPEESVDVLLSGET